jgi:hypothetical protein
VKALWHAQCNGIVSPKGEEWTRCHCGAYAARWRDGEKGIVEAASELGGREARILGLHNGYMLMGLGPEPLNDTQWRTAWALVRARTRDSYLFVRRESPLLVLAPGESGDTFWVDWPAELGDG